jgi:hypothetical protein
MASDRVPSESIEESREHQRARSCNETRDLVDATRKMVTESREALAAADIDLEARR